MVEDKQGRVMYSLYIHPEAKSAVKELAKRRGVSASEMFRQLLSLGLQHAQKSDGRTRASILSVKPSEAEPITDLDDDDARAAVGKAMTMAEARRLKLDKARRGGYAKQ